MSVKIERFPKNADKSNVDLIYTEHKNVNQTNGNLPPFLCLITMEAINSHIPRLLCEDPSFITFDLNECRSMCNH